MTCRRDRLIRAQTMRRFAFGNARVMPLGLSIDLSALSIAAGSTTFVSQEFRRGLRRMGEIRAT